MPKSDKAPSTADGQRKIEIPLPSDQDMDRVMSFLRARLEAADRHGEPVQKDVSGGKI